MVSVMLVKKCPLVLVATKLFSLGFQKPTFTASGKKLCRNREYCFFVKKLGPVVELTVVEVWRVILVSFVPRKHKIKLYRGTVNKWTILTKTLH